MARKLADPKPGDDLGYGNGSLIWDNQRGRPHMLFKHMYKGKRYTERGRSWAEVDDKRKTRIRALEDRAELAVDGSVAALCEAWLDFTRRSKGATLAAHTEDGYRSAIRHINKHLGTVPAAKLNKAMVRRMFVDLINDPKAEPLSARTLSSIRGKLSMIAEWGIEFGWMTTNPTREVKLPEGAAQPKPWRWFNLDEYAKVRDLLVAEHSTVHTLYLVMLQCGLRPGEAHGLRWDAIDFEAGTLRVEGAMRKARDGKRARSTTLKTDRHGKTAHRTLPMSPELAAVLKRERVEQFARGITDGVFDSVGKSQFDLEAGRIAKAAGVRYVNPNGYRHTFASVCLHNGLPPEQLADLMGHKDTTMITSFYGHAVAKPTAPDMARYLSADG